MVIHEGNYRFLKRIGVFLISSVSAVVKLLLKWRRLAGKSALSFGLNLLRHNCASMRLSLKNICFKLETQS